MTVYYFYIKHNGHKQLYGIYSSLEHAEEERARLAKSNLNVSHVLCTSVINPDRERKL